MIKLIVAKIGCGADTRHLWFRRAATDGGKRDDMTTVERARIKAFEHENCQLQQVNEILKEVSAYFVHAELDRPFWN